jgi:hypothetical protein
MGDDSVELTRDATGQRYFLADLPAFRVFGTRFAEMSRSVQDSYLMTPEQTTALRASMEEATVERTRKLHELAAKPTHETAGLEALLGKSSRLMGKMFRALDEANHKAVVDQLKAIQSNAPALFAELDALMGASDFLAGNPRCSSEEAMRVLASKLLELPMDEYRRVLFGTAGRRARVRSMRAAWRQARRALFGTTPQGAQASRARKPATADDHDLPDAESVRSAQAARGQAEQTAEDAHRPIQFVCYEVKALTDDQRDLFRWLRDHQEEVVPMLRSALVRYYEATLPELEERFDAASGEAPFLPKIATGRELDDLVRLTEIHLAPHESAIGFCFETAWDLEEDIGVRVDDGAITGVGNGQVACVGCEG